MESNFSSSEDEEQIKHRKMRCTISCIRKNNGILSIGSNKRVNRRRSSTIKLKNFVPKLKPINTILCPSPIVLNQVPHPPPELLRTQFRLLSTITHEEKNPSLSKPLKNTRKDKKGKQSLKVMNIDEDIYPISDFGDSSKKKPIIYSDSETSDNEDKYDDNKKKFSIMQNINRMREKLTKIRKKFFSQDKIFDDLDIRNCHTFMNKIRKIKTISSKSLKMIKYNTKSFSLQKKYVSTILGFLEKNKDVNPLNTTGN